MLGMNVQISLQRYAWEEEVSDPTGNDSPATARSCLGMETCVLQPKTEWSESAVSSRVELLLDWLSPKCNYKAQGCENNPPSRCGGSPHDKGCHGSNDPSWMQKIELRAFEARLHKFRKSQRRPLPYQEPDQPETALGH